MPNAILTSSTSSVTDVRAASPVPVGKPWLARARWASRIARTRLLWGWRLHSLGRHSVLGRALLVRNPGAISIGANVTIESQFVLADLRPGSGATPKIAIDDGCTILFRFQCNAAERVTLGKNVLVASNVLITDSDHVVEPDGIPTTRNTRLITRPVSVGDNCWLGQNAIILKGVTIGHHCIIGANTVVTRDVPPRSVVVGNPGRVVKRLPVPTGHDPGTPTTPSVEAFACT